MLTYRDQETTEVAASWLAALKTDVVTRPHRISDARDLVVDVGDFETAVADAQHPTDDGCGELGSTLRRASVAIASSFVALLDGDLETARASRATAVRLLAPLEAAHLPAALRRRVPEGFARYCLFPEQYRAAALRLAAEREPLAAVVVGLRSIGTALSAVVAATLRSRGIDVDSVTLRPHGHPFDRVLAPDRALTDALRRRTDRALYVIVDEGPGMSGSSFAAAATLLAELGVRPDAIVLMPSWEADGSTLLSPRARAIWSTHRRYVAAFERSWIRPLSGRAAREVSAGGWRDERWAGGLDVAVVPQHERRKFVLQDGHRRSHVARFAGLGRYGAAVRARAEALAQAGFGPKVVGFEDGFLELELVPGTALRRPADEEVMDRVARYTSFVARSFHSASKIDIEALVRMMRTNTREALGEEWTASLRMFEERARSLPDGGCIVDARMAPHEWVLGRQGITKVDAFDHGDDHFFPGPVDVAWDLAGAVVEFELPDRPSKELLERYVVVCGDRSITDRFAFYEAAYLAFRTGYASVAATLAGGQDATRFAELATTYRNRLRARLAAGPG
jgi:hypothetical protein